MFEVGGPLAAVCPLPEDLQNALDMLEWAL